ncbi:MAG: hypothetical protein VX379_03945 [Pseudomonadota bacterium]|nr:hypothetical protein [Pseudomonadota bacterium]MEE3321201.1 hypothetical protein [Pseudomonadota bacterium]
MGNKIQQTLWVTSINPEIIDGRSYIPTTLFYGSDGVSIGSKAQENENKGHVNSNFKVDLGQVGQGSSPENRKKFQCSDEKERSAFELSKDYIDSLLSETESNFPRSEATGYKHPAKIIVAEPLSFQIDGYSKQWISNYRGNIRRILDRYEEVDFLPEPFAVYQYYRYGLRLPHLQDKTKQIAFIVDFGGGTFDACVIESTNDGDVSIKGKASKPLAADSVPVGGYSINFEIAKYLIKRDLDNVGKNQVDKFLDQHKKVLAGGIDPKVLKSEFHTFIGNFNKLERSCEAFKVDLVGQISDWSILSDSYDKIYVSVPKDPFKSDDQCEVEFYSHQFREIFVRNIWDKDLKKVIEQVLDRAEDGLKGRPITVTLISGGSANIRWLEKLIVRDFSRFLENAEPVPISHSFQEIVANGLAIECARRFYSEESEFVAVTYNPVKLHLQSDDSDLVRDYRYTSVSDRVDMSEAKPGDIIPSAQALKNFFDDEVQWKIKLRKLPKTALSYYFCRAGDDEEIDRYNVEECLIPTKDSKHFDNKITVSLVIQEDGTVRPKFIYKMANKDFNVDENSVLGRPFYIDMTADSDSEVKKSNYVGFDFGTSNSSVCWLSQEKIKLTKTRVGSGSWEGLSGVVSELPYPIARVVREFLASTDHDTSARRGREVFEAVLAMMAYIAASEAAVKKGAGNLVKNFQHRSMGPLKSLLQSSMKLLGGDAEFSKGFDEIFCRYEDELDQAIKDFTNHKHDKLSSSESDWASYVDMIVRVFHSAFEDKLFGYCDNCNQDPFDPEKYEGHFIVAHDQPRFINPKKFYSTLSSPNVVALVVDQGSGRALSLTPFVFWFDRPGSDFRHACYFFDKPSGGDFYVKPCDKMEEIDVKTITPKLEKVYDDLFNQGKTMLGAFSLSLCENLGENQE